jgi:hypothetical protein
MKPGFKIKMSEKLLSESFPPKMIMLFLYKTEECLHLYLGGFLSVYRFSHYVSSIS